MGHINISYCLIIKANIIIIIIVVNLFDTSENSSTRRAKPAPRVA